MGAPATQAAPGPSKVASQAASDGADPLALTPGRPSSPLTRRASRRSARVAPGMLSSSPSIATLARGRRGRGREDEELVEDGDVVPPSDDDEYDEWKDARRAELKEREEKASAFRLARSRKTSEPASTSGKADAVKPKRPDRAPVYPQTPSVAKPRKRHTFVSLFSPVPSNFSSTASPTSSPPLFSSQTTPTQQLPSRHDPDDPFIPSQKKVVEYTSAYPVNAAEAWDGEDDELDLLASGKEMGEEDEEGHTDMDGARGRLYLHRTSGSLDDQEEEEGVEVEEEGHTLGREHLPTSKGHFADRDAGLGTSPHVPPPTDSRRSSDRDSRSPTPPTQRVLRNDFDETVPLGIPSASAPLRASVDSSLSQREESRSPTPETMPLRGLGAGYRSPSAASDRSGAQSTTPETMPMRGLGENYRSPSESPDRASERSVTPETMPLRGLEKHYRSPSEHREPTPGVQRSVTPKSTLGGRHVKDRSDTPETKDDEGDGGSAIGMGEHDGGDKDDVTVDEEAVEGVDTQLPPASLPGSSHLETESVTPQKASLTRESAGDSQGDIPPASAAPPRAHVISRNPLSVSQLSQASLSTYALSPHRSPTPQAVAFARSEPLYMDDDVPMQFDNYDDYPRSHESSVQQHTPRRLQAEAGSMPPPSLPRSSMATSPVRNPSSSPLSPLTPRKSQSPCSNNRYNPSPSRFSTHNPSPLRTTHKPSNPALVNSSPAVNLSPAFAAIARSSPAAPGPATSPFPDIPPDPELERFRTARTFRTRTVVQLQPYTKERQIYEAQLRKGGLKKARRPIPMGSGSHGAEDEDDPVAQARVSESSEATVSDSSSAEEGPSAGGTASGERIVIGNTPPPRVPRPARALIPLVDADFDEYHFAHGAAADETDDKCVRELQKIARKRVKAEKAERKREREAERERRRFERLVKEMDKEKREKEKAEREKQRAERDKEREERGREREKERERKKERAREKGREREKESMKEKGKERVKDQKNGRDSAAQDENLNKWKADLKGNLSDSDTGESPDWMDGIHAGASKAREGARDKGKKKRHSTPSKNRSNAKRTPGGTKTYASKDHNRRPDPISVDSDSESSAPRSHSNRAARVTTARRVVSPGRSDGTVTPSFQTAVSRQRDHDVGAEGEDADTGNYDMDNGYEGFNGYDGGDYGGLDEGTPPPPAAPPDSFIVDDMVGPARRHRPARSNTGTGPGSGSGSQASGNDADPPTAQSSSPPVNDPKFKVARRMMPTVMRRRLEKDAKEKERRVAERKRREKEAREREQRSASPVRPGKAVIRRGAGAGAAAALDKMAGFFTDGEGDSSAPEEDMPRQGPATSSLDYPIVIMDDSDSSEAVEDNFEQSLAQLHRGDFEGLVAGRRRDQAGKKKKVGRNKERQLGQGHRAGDRITGGDGKAKVKRPALGLVKRVRAPGHGGGENGKDMRQTHLDFPALDKPDARPSKKRKRKQNAGPHQRPAIRLDDHVIFAADEFEFDSSDEEVPLPAPAAKGRTFGRTKSTGSAGMGEGADAVSGPRARAQDVLDVGMGKARSWANFDKFPIDFDISPLPSGLYCHPESVPGSGDLVAFVSHLLESTVGGACAELDLVREYGIELEAGMTPGSIVQVLDIIFDAIHRQLIAIVNNSTSEELSVAPLEWLGVYIMARRDDIAEGFEGLRVALQEAVQSLTEKLDEVVVVYSRRNEFARNAILHLRWALYKLSCLASADDVVVGNASQAKEIPLVQDCATALLKQLLSLGFDKTIRPLKLILRRESESPEINDTSITMWIALLHGASAWDARARLTDGTTFFSALNRAIRSIFHLDHIGPIAAERVWFLVFGLCALSQFDKHGEIQEFLTTPRWSLVRRAVGLIRVTFDEKAEQRAGVEQLQGRDRYIKVMVARCVRLSAVWEWSFDRESFSVVTRDLGKIFKDRQYRNLPTEPPVDYPSFITRFDMALTAAGDTKRETAFELYLRLVCVAASDVIRAAQSLPEAQQAERDVQRLVITTIPVNPVKFDRLFPPTPKELGQLINRFSTMIAACYSSPSLLSHLLANYRTWSVFQQAPFDSRQIVIRGFMYLAVACRHHKKPLGPVVDRLAEILGVLQGELQVAIRGDGGGAGGAVGPQAPSKMEVERTMVLVVTCFRQVMKHHSFKVEEQKKPAYPDPCLLHQSWTVHIFDLELAKDLKCGLEVIATIQTFLDVRASALPRLARARRQERETQFQSESADEFGSLGIDFTTEEVLALGGMEGEAGADPVEEMDKQFAEIIENVISPKIYRLLSDMLPPVPEDEPDRTHEADRLVFLSKLTLCWSDCASVLVVEHQKLDWDTFISPFGKQSWARLGDERGRVQVGLHFMLNVAQLDPGSFSNHPEDFTALLFQTIGTDKLTIEHKYLFNLLRMSGVGEHPLLAPLFGMPELERQLDRAAFMEIREEVLCAIFNVIPGLLRSQKTPASMKSFVYRCINFFVSSLVSYDKAIDSNKVIHKESYRAFVDATLGDLKRLAGEFITPMSVPGLKYFAKS
ncbi:hypothetical protein IAT38_007175 [Cryptococcus sp. DSM 104549]